VKTVELSAGTYGLGEPTMAGWRRILTLLKPEDTDAILGIVASVQVNPEEQPNPAEARRKGMAAIAARVVPLLSRSVDLALALMDGCLRDAKTGRPVTEGTAETLMGSDLFAIVDAMVASDVFDRLVEQAKKVCGPAVRKLLEAGRRERERRGSESAPPASDPS